MRFLKRNNEGGVALDLNDDHVSATAAVLEQTFGFDLVVLPLPADFNRDQNSRNVRALGVDFDNHPYVRCTPFEEGVYLSDHAGRHANHQTATHMVLPKGTRVEALARVAALNAKS